MQGRIPDQGSGPGADPLMSEVLDVAPMRRLSVAPVEAGLEAAPPVRSRRRAASRRHARRVELSLLAGADAVTLLAATALTRSPVAVLAGLVAVLTWWTRGLYGRRIALSVLDDLPTLQAGVLLGVAPALVIEAALGGIGTGTLVVLLLTLVLGSVLLRSLAYAEILRLRKRGRLRYPTLMLGTGTLAGTLARRIAAHPESGLDLMGTLSTRTSPRGPGDLPVRGKPTDLAKVVEDLAISDVVVGYGGMPSDWLVDVLRTCDRHDVEIYVVPRLFEMHSLRAGDDRVWDVPLVRVRRSAHRVMTWRLKRLMDIVVSAAALTLAAPLILATAIAVRLELGSPLIFRQERVGLDGGRFDVLKFRSMRPAPTDGDSPWTVRGSDRIGPVGRFIRRYSLDELPQLYNVLRGDMSLVGPRPERPEYVERFSEAVPRYDHRHRVPVGLTGLAAVNGLRGDTSIEERAQFDNWYIENWSLWLDLKIIARTAVVVFRGTGS